MTVKSIVSGFLMISLLFSASAMSNKSERLMQQDHTQISQLILRWGYFRDHSMWPELADTFHSDGEIKLTWYIGKFSGFVARSKDMADGGVTSMHVMNPSIIDINGDRAIAITPVAIIARGKAGPIGEIDLTSRAQFVDQLERRSGQWRISKRVCVYQQDRIDSVLPSFKFWLLSLFMDTDEFDPAYKFLGMMLTKAGYPIQAGQVVDNTDAARALYANGQQWLRQ